MDMTLKFLDESPYKGLPADEGKLADVVLGFLQDPTEKIVILAFKDDEPVGMISGMISEHLFSREKTAFELTWWVHPEHRGVKTSIELFDAFEYWARRMNCKYVQFGAAQGTPYSDKVQKLYNRRGYRMTESNFLKELR